MGKGARWIDGQYTHRGRAFAGSSLHFEEIRLEALLDRLYGIVDGDLHQRDVDDADRAGASGRDGVYGDLIPMDYGIGVGTERVWNCATECGI